MAMEVWHKVKVAIVYLAVAVFLWQAVALFFTEDEGEVVLAESRKLELGGDRDVELQDHIDPQVGVDAQRESDLTSKLQDNRDDALRGSEQLHPEIIPQDPVLIEEQVNQQLESMSDIALLGQLFMLGYNNEVPSPAILRWIRDRNLGGVKVYGWNADNLNQLKRTLDRYQEAASENAWDIPLVIATDQEGGLVEHLGGRTTRLPSAMALGSSPSYQDSFNAGLIAGKELEALGINMNFAPNLDLYLDAQSSIVATRSFGADPQEVALHALAFIKGQRRHGVISMIKHYPGHGRTPDDSHGRLPQIDVSLEQLKAEELLPYKMLVDENVRGIMVGHLAFPQIVDKRTPSSRSEFFLTELLRDQWQYKGVVVTDDMLMYGARSGGLNLQETIYNSIMSGSDLLLYTRSSEALESTFSSLLFRMRKDRAFYARVKESTRRILMMKAIYIPSYSQDDDEQEFNFPSKENQAEALNIVAHSMSVRQKESFSTGDKPLFFIGPYSVVGREKNKFFKDARYFPVPYYPTAEIRRRSIASAISAAHSGYQVVIYVPHNYFYNIAKELESIADSLTIISTQKPTLVRDTPWFQRVLYLYNDNSRFIRLSLGVLADQISADSLRQEEYSL